MRMGERENGHSSMGGGGRLAAEAQKSEDRDCLRQSLVVKGPPRERVEAPMSQKRTRTGFVVDQEVFRLAKSGNDIQTILISTGCLRSVTANW